jgi:hypothetical protein
MFAHPSSFFRLDTIVHAVTSGCDIGMPLSVGQHAASVAQAAPAGTGAAGGGGGRGRGPGRDVHVDLDVRRRRRGSI